MKTRKILVLLIALMLLASAGLAGCGGKSAGDETTSSIQASTAAPTTASQTAAEDIFPLKDQITLKMTRSGWTDVRPPAGDLWMWKEYEKMTNIHVQWEEIPAASITERKNIIIATNDLPDCFYQLAFSNDEIVRFGNEGTFIPLEKLIDEHAPNIKKLLDENEVIKKALTMPDGHIYSLPYVQKDKPSNSVIFYLNKVWMDKLGLTTPNTLDEYTNILRAFKTGDPNGNGKNDEYPLAMSAGFLSPIYERSLYGVFGLGNRGGQAVGMWIDEGPDGKVRFIVKDPRFKEVWQYENMLWEEGLMHPETISGVDYTRWTTDAANNLVGAFNFVSPGFIGASVAENYEGVVSLKGPHGDQILSWTEPSVRGISSFMITKNNKNPIETIKWVDYFYSEEGSIFGFFGKEGVTYTKDSNGDIQYIDEIKNYESGVQLGSFQWVDNVYGGFYPFIEPADNLKLKAMGTTMQKVYRTNLADYDNYCPETLWPTFNSTADESAELAPIVTDMTALIGEMMVKFITGELDFDKDWDGFMQRLDKAGAQKYLQIRQKQYDRMYNK